jgi:hypothetical protein
VSRSVAGSDAGTSAQRLCGHIPERAGQKGAARCVAGLQLLSVLQAVYADVLGRCPLPRLSMSGATARLDAGGWTPSRVASGSVHGAGMPLSPSQLGGLGSHGVPTRLSVQGGGSSTSLRGASAYAPPSGGQ